MKSDDILVITEKIYSELSLLIAPEISDGLLYNISLVTINDAPIHYHDSLELVYVVKGTVRARISYDEFDLAQGDFLLINSYETHRFYSDSVNEVIIVHLKRDILHGRLFAYHPEYYRNYNSAQVREIKGSMLELLELNDSGDTCAANEEIDRIEAICDQYFPIQNFDYLNQQISPYYNKDVLNDRIKNIYETIYFQYYDKIQLNDIAEKEHLDQYYTSKMIKGGTGESFQKILNSVRVDRAELFLLGSDDRVHEITSHLGFSSYDYFNRLFKDETGLTASEYRKKYLPISHPNAKFDSMELDSDTIRSDGQNRNHLIEQSLTKLYDVLDGEDLDIEIDGMTYSLKFTK